MTPAELSARLSAQAESVCRHLLPNGRRVRNEWVAGDPYGSEGDSFKIVIEGEKVGVGKDFAGGEKCGDLLDLWCLNQNVALGEAMAQARSFLHLVPDGEATRPKKHYQRPERPKAVRRLDREGPVYAYLRSRGMTDEVLEDFRVSEVHDQQGDWMVFPYLRDNKFINAKYIHIERTDGKKRCRQEKNAEPCLFGWDALDKRFPNERRVVLTEGEMDCMTYHQCGIPALSVPNGGGGGAKQDWIFSDYDRLSRFDHIYISMDNDPVGKEATAEIIKRLGSERCRIVELPHKDANECFSKGIKDFRKYLLSSRVLDPDELKPAGFFKSKVLDRFYPKEGSYRGMKTPWPGLTNNLMFRKPEFILWYGYDGCGKSVLLNHVMLQGLEDGEKFCVASMEMPADVTLWRLVRQISGEELPSRERADAIIDWLDDKLWIFNLVGSAKSDRLFEVFRYAKCRYDIRNFIIDSLTKIDIREDDYSGQKQFAVECVDFSHKYETTMHLIAHTRKGESEEMPPNKFDIRGAAGLSNVASTVISVWRYKEPKVTGKVKEAPKEHFDTMITVEKQRETGWLGRYGLYFEPKSMQFHETKVSVGTDHFVFRKDDTETF